MRILCLRTAPFAFLTLLTLLGVQSTRAEDASKQISHFELVNADNNKIIKILPSSFSYDDADIQTTNMNIQAIPGSSFPELGSMLLSLDQPKKSFCDRKAPFTLFRSLQITTDNGEKTTNYSGKYIPAGNRTITATAYSSRDCSGAAGNTLLQDFHVQAAAPNDSCLSAFRITDAATKEIFRTMNTRSSEITHRPVIKLGRHRPCNLTIEAVVGDCRHNKVRFVRLKPTDVSLVVKSPDGGGRLDELPVDSASFAAPKLRKPPFYVLSTDEQSFYGGNATKKVTIDARFQVKLFDFDNAQERNFQFMLSRLCGVPRVKEGSSLSTTNAPTSSEIVTTSPTSAPSSSPTSSQPTSPPVSSTIKSFGRKLSIETNRNDAVFDVAPVLSDDSNSLCVSLNLQTYAFRYQLSTETGLWTELEPILPALDPRTAQMYIAPKGLSDVGTASTRFAILSFLTKNDTDINSFQVLDAVDGKWEKVGPALDLTDVAFGSFIWDGRMLYTTTSVSFLVDGDRAWHTVQYSSPRHADPTGGGRGLLQRHENAALSGDGLTLHASIKGFTGGNNFNANTVYSRVFTRPHIRSVNWTQVVSDEAQTPFGNHASSVDLAPAQLSNDGTVIAFKGLDAAPATAAAAASGSRATVMGYIYVFNFDRVTGMWAPKGQAIFTNADQLELSVSLNYKLSPDGNRLFVTKGRGELEILDYREKTETWAKQELPSSVMDNDGGMWSSNGIDLIRTNYIHPRDVVEKGLVANVQTFRIL